MRIVPRLLLALLGASLLTTPAAEASTPLTVCTEAALLEHADELTAWSVNGVPKARFASCPDAKCEQRSYLVQGDTVLTAPGPAGWACALFPSAKRAATVGWLPAGNLVPAPTPVGSVWAGAWLKEGGGFYLYESPGRVTGRGKTWMPNALAPEGGAESIVVSLIELDGAPQGPRLDHRKDGCLLRLNRVGPYLVAVTHGCGEDDLGGVFLYGYEL